MGVYDMVRFVGFCVRCGCRMKGFQTKDGDCTMAYRTVEECDEWYGECPDCGLWFDFKHTIGNNVFHPSAKVEISYIKREG